MKNILAKSCIAIIACCLMQLTLIAQTKPVNKAEVKNTNGRHISIKLKPLTNCKVYIGSYYGKSLVLVDSTMLDANGQGVFKGDSKLTSGVYFVVTPQITKQFEFLMDDIQHFNIEGDTTIKEKATITGSQDNDLFKAYISFSSEKGQQLQNIRNDFNAAKTKADSTLHLENYNKFNKELIDFRDKLMKENPESMMALMLNAMREPEILNKEPKTRQDTLDNYYNYKQHYWDGVSFTDDRVIRTPFFLPKLERYYREIIQQAPDSIIKDLDYKLLLARVSPEMYKFLLNWFTDEYINPKYMGQDAVFVHLFEKYHSKGVSTWLNEKQQETISRRAYMQMSNLIGVKAANLEMVDSTGKLKPLYDLNAEYTLVVFWDPTCGHCKEEIPRIDSIYRASWKAKGVRIYSVLSDNDKKKEWVDYLKEHKLGDWTNVYETKEMEKAVSDAQRAGFRQLYDVIQTPTILLLDKEKRVVGKKLSWEQLNDFLVTKWKEKKQT